MHIKIPSSASLVFFVTAFVLFYFSACSPPKIEEPVSPVPTGVAPKAEVTPLSGQQAIPLQPPPSEKGAAATPPSSTEKNTAKKTAADKSPKLPLPIAAKKNAPTPELATSPNGDSPQPVPALPVPTMAPKKTSCGADLPPETLTRDDVYRGRPFAPGESAHYEVSYMGVHAGFGNIDVEQPIKYEGIWHQVFSGNASTGEWYERIFIVRDKLRAVSRPWDFGAAQFYMEQNEGSLFGKRFQQKKWITYDHETCKANEKTENRKKELKNDQFPLEPGADDAMSAYFYLRTVNFTVGHTERVLVYTSEKNWYLDAKAVAVESVVVKAGKFNAVKLELKTYLGKDLQQKGTVFLWIATDHPAKPMVKVEAEVKIGRVQIDLAKFTPGSN